MPPRHNQPHKENAHGGTANLRHQLDQLKQGHQKFDAKFDATQDARREVLRTEKEQRVQGFRQQAADNLLHQQKREANRTKMMALIVLVCAVAAAVVFGVLSRAGFFAGDAVCAVRRLTRSVGQRDIAKLRAAVADSYQASVHSPEHNRTFFWGTYRPNALAGVKSREEQPLLFGLAWWDGAKMFPVRHTAEDGEAVFFRWDVHDGRWYGREVIEDRQLGMRLNVRFAKSATRDGWVVSIQSARRTFRPLAFALYFASEFGGAGLGVRSRRPVNSAVAPTGLAEGAFSTDSKLLLHGKLQTNNQRFLATVDDAMGARQESQWQVFAMRPPAPASATGHIKEAWKIDFLNGLRGGARLAEHVQYQRQSPPKASAIVMMKKVSGDFRFDVTLSEQHGIEDELVFQDACANEAVFDDLERSFDERFEAVFEMTAHHERLRAQWPDAFRHIPLAHFKKMTESGLSNLLGGTGFWHGDYRVQTKAGNPRRGVPPTIETHGPRTLFSGVPSRAKFPRGFLWDEGFHQLLVHHWDRALSEDVLLHWLSLMEPNGWIPREQILGPEARTRVPDEFVPQHPEHTNPPAMVLVLQGMLLDASRKPSSGQGESQVNDAGDEQGASDTFSAKVLPQLGKWFRFVVESQCGGDPAKCSKERAAVPASDKAAQQGKPGFEGANASFLFRWRSRNGYHLLASGLDDYPRPHCKAAAELHLDLFCWVHMMARSMKMLQAQVARESSGVAGADSLTRGSEFGRMPQLVVDDAAWKKWLVALHWDEERKQFSDQKGCGGGGGGGGGGVDEKKKKFSPFFGYVNLWPILTLSLDADQPEHILAVLRKAHKELSGGKGLQSLSNRSRRLLDKHDDYWTGPIWINVNFLFLRALHRKYIGVVGEEARAIYDEVRRDVLANVGRVFVETGKLWENYDLATGNGRGTAPFTGWTTLVILIAAEKY